MVFRLHPEAARTLFVRVRILPDVEAVQARGRELRDAGHSRTRDWRDTVAFCTEWLHWRVSEGGRSRRDPCVAEVVLSRDRCDIEVVTHELFHAALCWARRAGFDWARLGSEDSVTEEEEWLAHVHSDLCVEFVDRAVAAGIYD